MATIFTVEEARAFRYQGALPLADEAVYEDDLIQATAERITEDFAEICGVAFVPTVSTRILDGGGVAELLLPDPRVISVDTVEEWVGLDWVASTTTYRPLAGGFLYNDLGGWSRGRANLRVTYTHGYATPPAQVKYAALILAVNDLLSNNISDRATQQTNENGTYNLAVAGWREGQWYGLPPVDSVLARYNARMPGVG